LMVSKHRMMMASKLTYEINRPYLISFLSNTETSQHYY
jgi:hypothetical protein